MEHDRQIHSPPIKSAIRYNYVCMYVCICGFVCMCVFLCVCVYVGLYVCLSVEVCSCRARARVQPEQSGV